MFQELIVYGYPDNDKSQVSPGGLTLEPRDVVFIGTWNSTILQLHIRQNILNENKRVTGYGLRGAGYGRIQARLQIASTPQQGGSGKIRGRFGHDWRMVHR